MIALLAAGTVGVLRLPMTLLRSPADGRADVVVSASVPSHVVRLPAPTPLAPRADIKHSQAPAAAPVTRAIPTPVTAPVMRPAPAKLRVKVTAPRRHRVVLAEIPTALVVPAVAAAPAPAPVPLAAPVVAPAPVVVVAPVATPEDRDRSDGKEKKKQKHEKRAKHEVAAKEGEVQLFAAVAPVEAPAVEPSTSVADDGDDAEQGKRGKHGHDKH